MYALLLSALMHLSPTPVIVTPTHVHMTNTGVFGCASAKQPLGRNGTFNIVVHLVGFAPLTWPYTLMVANSNDLVQPPETQVITGQPVSLTYFLVRGIGATFYPETFCFNILNG